MKTGRKSTILCFSSYYLPGLKSGGPLRSLLHMQEWLGDEHAFFVVTRNRDLGDRRSYEGAEPGRWHPVHRARVWYLSAPCWSPRSVARAFAESQPDLLYFHSAFDPCLTIMPLLLRRVGFIPMDRPAIVAPRGEFSPGARSLKQLKKDLFLRVARAINLYRQVTWQATNEEEAKHIRALWGSQARISVAPNLPSRTSKDTPANRTPKHAGTLRLVFLSRISRMKNLNGALAMLGDITATVDFDIYGTQEDRQYWDECQQLIGKLPPNIRATYRGSVDPDDVIPTLAAYDALLLPTLGENFGHVILEALLAGCPALLSDQTPWRHLADSQAGFDIPLDDTSQFQRAIEYFAEMDDAAHAVWSSGARRFGLRYASNPELVGLTRAMLAEAKSPTGNN